MSDLLKQAIADAKAVRATALANAKAALEEAFAPKLQSMLSEKLRQEVEGGLEEEGEVPVPGVGETPAPAAELPPPPPPAPAPAAPMEEVGQEDDMEENTHNQPGTSNAGNPNPIAEEKASGDYKKTTKGHHTEDPGKKMVVSAEKLHTPGGPKAAGENRKASDDYTKTTSGHKTDDPQGQGNELSDGAKKTEDQTSNLSEEIEEGTLDEILAELEKEVNEVGGMEEMSAPMEAAPAPAPEAEMDEVVDLDELLKEEGDEANEGKEEVVEGEVPPQLKPFIKKKKGGDDDDEGKEGKAHEKAEKGEKKKTDESVINENISLKKENAEYRSAVEFLRDRINEVNLLNAKLLYANKLFKQANLSREQKIKVIESFDLTKSVREAKIVYATLAESFNFGVKKEVEPVKASATVKTITEGLASKAVASTKPTKPAVIAEGADMANRFKKLAGIR